MPARGRTSERSADRAFAIGVARALGGAVIFALPLLMTMEMWEIAFYVPPLRLAVLVALSLPMLVFLSYYAGFRETSRLRDDVLDAFVALALGALASTIVLLLVGALTPGMTTHEVVGKIALQTVPASIGALLADDQLGGEDKREEHEEKIGVGGPGYLAELALMAVGALFLGFNVAPTEEIVLIQYRLAEWQILVVALVSVAVMHAFVYAVEFHGQEKHPEHVGPWEAFLRFTLVGYIVALLTSAFVLWVFGRFDGLVFAQAVEATVVLGLPAAVGAAAARLVL